LYVGTRNVCGTAIGHDPPPGRAGNSSQNRRDSGTRPGTEQKRYRRNSSDGTSYLSHGNALNSHRLMDLAVKGLSAADIHILEDGKEQEIERVTDEPGGNMDVPSGSYQTPSAGHRLDRPIDQRRLRRIQHSIVTDALDPRIVGLNLLTQISGFQRAGCAPRRAREQLSRRR